MKISEEVNIFFKFLSEYIYIFEKCAAGIFISFEKIFHIIESYQRVFPLHLHKLID